MVQFLAGLIVFLLGLAIGFAAGVISNQAEEEE
jgi:hypothetical protein